MIGARLGPYEITGSLGAGGMGEVYRARDAKLDRDVALKILPESFASDPDPSADSGSSRAQSRDDRLMRFEREAKTLAALNHPHIAHIHGIEDSGGTRALVMELVEGEDIAQRIARGPVPLEEALPIARQIAEALEAAHEAGIIHRDLKPANIKVRPDGTVKVLDFGLAKSGLSAGAPSGAKAVAPGATVTSPAMTMQGVILGTAAYMAPEQARGKPVDRRADIWAFGCVLYETLTGRRAFEGEDVTDTIAAVVTKEPDWSRLPAETPASVERLLRRCLEKQIAKRLPHIGVARLELDDIPASDAAAQTTTSAARGRDRAAGALAADLFVVELDGPRTVRPLLQTPFNDSFADISPDGRWIAYMSTRSGRGEVWVAAFPAMTNAAQVSISGGSYPRWGRDGKRLYFYWANNVWSAEVGGGPAPAISKPTLVTELPTVRPRGVFDVMPDGRILFVDGRDVGGTPELRIVLNWSTELRRLFSIQ